MTFFGLVQAVAYTPLLAGPIFYRIHLHRQATKLERNGGVEAAFAPADPPAPGLLLRRFSLPERAYLLRYKTALLVAFGVLLWLFLVNMSSGLFSSAIAKTGFTGSVQQNIWYSYIDQLTDVFVIISMFSLAAGAIAVADIGMIDAARFPRSRPISRRLLFWGRVLPSLATILTAFVIAALLSLLLLRLCYGPVYNHIQSAASALSHPGSADGDTDDLTLLLQTSLPAYFLSGITTLLLGFSLAVAAMMLPFQMKCSPILAGAVWLGFLGYQGFLFIASGTGTGPGRYFFLYTAMGPPPPYAFALVPILLSTALLLLASRLSNRLQT